MRVRGNSLVPPSVLNRFSILCAILRQLHLVLQISLLSSELGILKPDVFFIDQLSACVPLLRVRHRTVPVLFYCHFPDKLLAYRESILKKLYRIPFDWWESWSTGCSNTIVVNSNFTKGIFAEAFPRLQNRNPEVVYPCVNAEETDKSETSDGHLAEPGPLWKDKKVLLSINRFERKKDVGLAIQAFAQLDIKARSKARLVVAGGYDTRVNENVSYHKELCSLAESMKIKVATAENLVSALSVPEDIGILFLLSVPSSLKKTLLETASLLIYTPKYEHFGIVPLEAMLARVPVLAAKTGGPRETVVEGETGWLRDVDVPAEWTDVMQSVLLKLSDAELSSMGQAGRKRVIEKFGRDSMATRIYEVMGRTSTENGPNVAGQLAVVSALTSAILVFVISMIIQFT